MTPERLAMVQELVRKHEFGEWGFDEVRRIKEPVCFQPRHGTNVYDLPKNRYIYCTLRTGLINLVDQDGFPTTPKHELIWIEVEGVVVEAHPMYNDGFAVAQDVVGMDCPRYKAERERAMKMRSARLLVQKLEAGRT